MLMKLPGPVMLIDDDEDDRNILLEVLHQLDILDVKPFDNCPEALEYLLTTTDKPFLILCDINLPGMNGMEFRREINGNHFLREKSIPFVFLSTSAMRDQVLEAYLLTVQGFFVKQFTMQKTKTMLKNILEYWESCIHPNVVK